MAVFRFQQNLVQPDFNFPHHAFLVYIFVIKNQCAPPLKHRLPFAAEHPVQITEMIQHLRRIRQQLTGAFEMRQRLLIPFLKKQRPTQRVGDRRVFGLKLHGLADQDFSLFHVIAVNEH